MNKKKSKKKKSQSSKSKFNLNPPLIDPRAMEKTMSDIGKLLEEQQFESLEEANAFLQGLLGSGKIPALPKHTPLEQAQDLMYEAWNSSGRRRVELALQALDLSKDCADAYVLLAEEVAPSLPGAKELYEQGVKAGERALGPETFKEAAGHFWGIIETRPYMRARAGLAQCLWMLGERQSAIEHYADMLRLNPGDNQGIRYILANCLLEEGSDDAIERLLDQYEDDAAAAWLYTRAIWMFRREADSPKANALLKKALDQNRFVPPYLLGRKRLPSRLPDYIGFGDENEAVAYAAEAIEGWRKTPGALDWLSNHLPAKLK